MLSPFCSTEQALWSQYQHQDYKQHREHASQFRRQQCNNKDFKEPDNMSDY